MPIRPTDDPTTKAMKGINLFHYSQSNCAMRIRIALEEKGLLWNSHYINLDTQDNLTDEYFRIHPHGLVPSLVHDGEIVYESSDILRYLEEKYPEPSLIPDNPEQRAEMEEWLDLTRDLHIKVIKVWVYGTERYCSKTKESMKEYIMKQPNQELIDFHKMTLARGHIPQAMIDEAAAKLHALFARIDSNLEKYEWLVCDKMTLADIAWIPNYTLLNFNNFPFEQYPHALKWINRFISRPSYIAGVDKWFDYVPE
ncbi:MAG: glutathione S-transferase family protein [Porticoccaceae bacterium]|nr:glutathione S-transferase family protein [Porticoccaceae bacterium]